MVTGRDLLSRLDRDIARLRDRLRDAVEAADEATADEARLRADQLTKYTELASIRLDFLREGHEPRDLDRTHRDAMALLGQHEGFVAAEAEKMNRAAQDLLDLEQERAGIAAQFDEATATYDARVTEIEAGLADNADYQRLTAAQQEATAIASRATQKLKLAEEDRRTKGAPYEADPLFRYLWKRKFRTPAYRAFPFFRMLDNWVADLCGYDGAALNYQRLTELPERLAEHADDVADLSEAADAELDAFEQDAMDAGGATSLREAADGLAQALAAMDARIIEGERLLHDLTEAHGTALRAETGPAVAARQMIEQKLSEATLPSLRVMAAETLALSDDHIVDSLVQLRADEAVVGREGRAATQRVSGAQADLKQVELCRQRIKAARFDSPYVTFRDGSVDDVLGQLERGALSGADAFDRLKRLVRRSGGRTSGFGGRRRTRTMGVPDILGDVMWEVAREAMRSSQRGNWGGYSAPRRSRPATRRPRSSGRRSGGGGFRTGGGF